MKSGGITLAKSWNLNWRARLVVTCFALGYLLVLRPWSQPDLSISVDSYSCAGAVFTLALLPRGTRLWLAMGAALGIGLLILIVGLQLS